MINPHEIAHERHRRSIRFCGYDYSGNGAYFITICTQNREHFFGKIENGNMWLNDAGRMIDRWWNELGNRFPDIELDAFVVMPNHVHGIIVIKNAPVPVGTPMYRGPYKGDHIQKSCYNSSMHSETTNFMRARRAKERRRDS